MSPFRLPRVSVVAALVVTALVVAAGPSRADDYPNRPIRLLVGYSAGGGVDSMARLLAPRLGAALGQQLVVENRAGAAGLIAGDVASRAAPDGYTLMLGDSSMLIAQYLQDRMSFDPIKAFAPVSGLFTLPVMIIANNAFPAKTPAELVAALKAKPGGYSFATSGVGTVQHLGFAMLEGQAGVVATHIPYRGAAQILPDVIGGQVPLGVVSATAGLAQAKAGKLRAVAMMSDDRLQGAEGVAALSTALPGFQAAPRLFLLAPAGTPKAIVDRLDAATRAVLAAPDLAQAAALQGAIPAYQSSSQLATSLVQESARWGKVVKDQKITAE